MFFHINFSPAGTFSQLDTEQFAVIAIHYDEHNSEYSLPMQVENPQKIADFLKNNKHLHADITYIPNTKKDDVSDKFLSKIGEIETLLSKKFNVVSLTLVREIDEKIMALIAKNCPSIQSLNIALRLKGLIGKINDLLISKLPLLSEVHFLDKTHYQYGEEDTKALIKILQNTKLNAFGINLYGTVPFKLAEMLLASFQKKASDCILAQLNFRTSPQSLFGRLFSLFSLTSSPHPKGVQSLTVDRRNQIRHWQRLATILAFIRANRGSYFKFSGLPLVPEIMRYLDQKPARQVRISQAPPSKPESKSE